MSAKNPKEVFLFLLSDARNGADHTGKLYHEMGELAGRPEIKEILEARAFLQNKIISSLDQCFKLIGEKPVPVAGRLREVFAEDFRREVAEIQSPAAKVLFVLAKASHLTHLRMGEYEVLIAAADMTGHHGVGLLLESCLADQLALMERIRRTVRHLIEEKVEGRDTDLSKSTPKPRLDTCSPRPREAPTSTSLYLEIIMNSRSVTTAAGLLACGVIGLIPAARAAEPAKSVPPGISAEVSAALQQRGKTLSANEFSFQARPSGSMRTKNGQPLHIFPQHEGRRAPARSARRSRVSATIVSTV